MTSKVEIISGAFVLLGKSPINSIGNGPPIVDGVSKLFDLIYPTLISMHNWRFAMNLATLSPLTVIPPMDRWQHVYLLPADLLRLFGTYPETINYVRYENYIYTNAFPTLTIEYSFLPDLNKWPIYFKNLMTIYLAAEAAMLVTEDGTIAEYWSQKGLAYLANSRSMDSQQQPSSSIIRDSILSRKYGY